MLCQYIQGMTGDTTGQDKRHNARRTEEGLIKSRRSILWSTLGSISRTITSFNEILGYSLKFNQLKMTVPIELKSGWLHLVMSFIHLSRDLFLGETTIRDAQFLIGEGLNKMVKSSSTKTLSERSVVLPLEIVSLISLKLLQDVTRGRPDISEIYSSHIESIVS